MDANSDGLVADYDGGVRVALRAQNIKKFMIKLCFWSEVALRHTTVSCGNKRCRCGNTGAGAAPVGCILPQQVF